MMICELPPLMSRHRKGKLGTTVFEHGIRRSVAMSENPQLHEGITDYAPNSDAAQDARLVTDELIERIQEAEQR